MLIFYREDEEDREKLAVLRRSGTSGGKEGFGLSASGSNFVKVKGGSQRFLLCHNIAAYQDAVSIFPARLAEA